MSLLISVLAGLILAAGTIIAEPGPTIAELATEDAAPAVHTLPWQCGACSHQAHLEHFYARPEPDVPYDYRCPACGTTDNAHLGIPRLDVLGKPFYVPTPKQVEFHLSTARNTLYGGRAGTGKSWALRNEAHMRCLSIPGYRALIVRRNFTELRDTHLDKCPSEAQMLGAVWRATENTIVYANGSRLRFGHVDNDDALKLYLSSEFEWIGFDEGSTFTQYQFRFLGSRLRTVKPGVVPLIKVGSNPGAMWLYKVFINKNVDAEIDDWPGYNPDHFSFIPATIEDNPHQNREEYEMRLNALPSEALRKMYRDGDWTAVEGQFFSEFISDRKLLVTDEATGDVRVRIVPWHVVEELPRVNGRSIAECEWIDWTRAIDWGYDPDEGVCTWFAHLPSGRMIAVMEYTFKKTLPKDAAKEIKRRSQGMRIRMTCGGPDMWMSDNQLGESIADTFAKHGISMYQANTDRVNGWVKVHEYLKDEINEGFGPRPKLQIYKTGCPLLVQTFPMAQCHPTKLGDIKQAQDHWIDTVRYALMTRPSGSREKKTSTLSKEARQAIYGRQGRAVLGTESVRRRR
jgi:hypothetical protein